MQVKKFDESKSYIPQRKKLLWSFESNQGVLLKEAERDLSRGG